MRVSVVIPLFNKANHVQRAVCSVLRQSFRDLEVVVVDDGSTDGGGDLCRLLADPRLRVVTTANRGVSAARNLGCREASCELVAFLDADDEWLPDFLETVLALHDRFPEAGMFAAAYQIRIGDRARTLHFHGVPVSPDGGVIEDYFKAAWRQGPVCSSNVMVKKAALEEAGGFPEDLRRHEDIDTWLRIAVRHPVAWSSKPLALWHQDTVNSTRQWLPYGIPPMSATFERLQAQGCRPLAPVASVQEYIVKNELFFVTYNLVAGRKDLARRLLRHCRGTSVFRRKWLALKLISCLPCACIVALYKLNELRAGQKTGRLSFRDISRGSA